MAGTITISLEIELGWGVHHLPDTTGIGRHSQERQLETETLQWLLDICDDLHVPISFDIVGHLLLEECMGDHSGPHERGWFDADPGTDVETNPLYYAPDLVRSIVEAETAHEICTHTFSHVPCQEVNEAVVDWELRQAHEHHEAFGLDPPRTLVPPMHSPPPLESLHANGLTGVRRPTVYREPVKAPQPPNSVLRWLPWYIRQLYPVEVLARSHPVCDLRLVNGVVEHYTSWHASLTAPYLPNGQIQPHPAFRIVPTSVRQSLHERYLSGALRRAIEQNSHAHVWSHLFNLSNEAQQPPVKSFLESIAQRREQGLAEISTMAEETKTHHDTHA